MLLCYDIAMSLHISRIQRVIVTTSDVFKLNWVTASTA